MAYVGAAVTLESEPENLEYEFISSPAPSVALIDETVVKLRCPSIGHMLEDAIICPIDPA